jgi:hypothetical protein
MTECMRCGKESVYAGLRFGLCVECEFDYALKDDNRVYDAGESIIAFEELEADDIIAWDEWNQQEEDNDMFNQYRGQ